MYHETPLFITPTVFYNSAEDTLYVPAGTKKLYQSSYVWRNFQNIVEMTPSEPEITINSNILTNGLVISHEQGEQSIQFSCNADWTLTIADVIKSSSWCTASLTEGTKGDATVKFSVTENTDYEDRSVSVTIKSGSLSKTFTITQKSAEALLVTTNKYEMAQEGGTINVEVKANVDYQIEIDENCKSWISEITTRALTTYTHSFKIAANENEDKREGKIYVKSGDKVETIKVYQAEKSILILSQNEYEVSEMGETISVDIRSNVDYGIEMPNVDWISELSTRSASSHTLKFVVSPNETTDVRTAEIVFYDKNSDLQETLTVVQAGNSATANEIVFASTVFNVQGTDGGVIIHSDKMIDLSIYDMNGLLLIRKRINGSEQISLPKGFYILSADNQNQKLIIK